LNPNQGGHVTRTILFFLFEHLLKIVLIRIPVHRRREERVKHVNESEKNERLANSVLEIIDEVGRGKVPPGLIGLAGELFVLSKLYADLFLKSKIEYYGGRKPYDIGIRSEGGIEKKVLIKTNLYGEIEKETFGVEEGFLWSDVRVERTLEKEGNLVKRIVDFDFVVLVGIRGKRPRFFVLTKDEFMDLSSGEFGWGRSRGTRVIGLVEKTVEDESRVPRKVKEYIDHFGSKHVVDAIRESENKWAKIADSLPERLSSLKDVAEKNVGPQEALEKSSDLASSSVVRESKEKHFDLKALASRLEKVFPAMVKLHEDEGCIWVMDKVKLTEKGVVKGYGSVAERAKLVYRQFLHETRSKAF
jgi:hypothetical protein